MGISARSLAAGKAVIEMSLLDGMVDKQLAALESKLGKIGGAFQKLGAIGMAAGAAITGAFAAAVTTFTTVGSDLNDMSLATGFSAESLSRLGYAAKQNRSNLATLETGIKGMNKVLLGAERGSKQSIRTLSDLGLTFGQLKALSPEQRFIAFADAIARVDDPSRRAALAVKVFGGAGEQLLPMLVTGRAGIEALTAEADALGITIDTKTATAADALGDAFDKVKDQLKALVVQIGSALEGELQEWTQKITEILRNTIAWTKENRAAVVLFAEFGAALTALSAAAYALGTAIKVVSASVGLLRVAITLLTAHPLVALATVVGAIVIAFLHWSGALDKVYDRLGRLMGLIPDLKKEADALTASLEAAGNERREELKNQIAANREIHGNPWGIGNSPRPGADNSAFRADAARMFNNLLGMLPAELQAKITGAALPPAVEDALKRVGQAVGQLSNAMAAPDDISDAIRNLKALNDQRLPSFDTITRRADPMFDTRFLKQAFGTGADDVQKQQLEIQKQIAKNTSRRGGGLPVI